MGAKEIVVNAHERRVIIVKWGDLIMVNVNERSHANANWCDGSLDLLATRWLQFGI